VVRELAVAGVRQLAANAQVLVASEGLGKSKTVVTLVAIGALLLAFDARTGGPLATIGIGPLAHVTGGWLLVTAMILAVMSGISYLVQAWPILTTEDRDKDEGPPAI
jgi:CDP-diacylglycerol--glycerol-3-phosphate 3-phosphatidyltransferase